MLEHWLANLVLLVHFGFVVFVCLGGVAVLRWPRLAWLHLPAVAWGVLIELTGWVCPLTPLENTLRRSAGEAGYEGGCIHHYITSVLYPGNLTRIAQVVLAIAAVGVNAAVYLWLWRRRRRQSPPDSPRRA